VTVRFTGAGASLEIGTQTLGALALLAGFVAYAVPAASTNGTACASRSRPFGSGPEHGSDRRLESAADGGD